MPTTNELHVGHTDMSYLPTLVVSADFVVSLIVLAGTVSVVTADDKLSVDSVVSTETVLAAAKRIPD